MKIESASEITAIQIHYIIDYDKAILSKGSKRKPQMPEDTASISFKTNIRFVIDGVEVIKEVSNTIKVDNEEMLRAIRAENNRCEIVDGVKTGAGGRFLNFT